MDISRDKLMEIVYEMIRACLRRGKLERETESLSIVAQWPSG